jgi:hypothetical protein
VIRYDVHAFPILHVSLIMKDTVFSGPMFLKLCSNRTFFVHEVLVTKNSSIRKLPEPQLTDTGSCYSCKLSLWRVN